MSQTAASPSTTALPTLQALLLDLISPMRAVRQSQLDALSEADWGVLLRMVQQHRLGPLLHWQMGQAHTALQLPAAVANRLARSFKKGTLRSLNLQRELILVSRILHAAGIPCIALKGAFLAFHAYPQAALRPMRDLDILVPADQALKAYEVLLEGGLSRIGEFMATPEAAIEVAQHFPPLRSPSDTVNVEVHNRVTHASHIHPNLPDWSADPQFWRRASHFQVGQAAIGFESPADLLLHLIVHAVYDHEFTNGPLVLSDLAFLLRSHTIDWPLFWSLAKQGDHTRGCVLTLHVTQLYWGQLPIVWSQEALAVKQETEFSMQAEQSSLLMLRDMDAWLAVNMQVEMSHVNTVSGRVGYLLGRLFVHKAKIASLYPVKVNSWRIYFWYPVYWWRLISLRLSGVIRSNQQTHLQNEVTQLTQVKAWLKVA